MESYSIGPSQRSHAGVSGTNPQEPQCQWLCVTKKSDALPMISVIVVIFVLLAVFIIIVVHYGPHLRTIQITLYHEPMPQDLDGGVYLTDWKKLGSQRKQSAQYCQRELDSKDMAGVSYQCSCKHHFPCRNAEPNVIEITYL
uniref:Small integral membrane protein 33 n=1 Tax=Apteryx owenii TaxID=8824 RepID=A0A8B9NTH4_APTOW